MLLHPENNSEQSAKEKLPEAEMGNASNPSPNNTANEPPHPQLLDKKAGIYLREAGNIEDVPDPQEQQQADETIRKEKKGEV